MLKSHQDVMGILNGFLKNYNITRAFNIVETAMVPGVRKIQVQHNEEGILKLNIEFYVSYNEVCKAIVHHCIVNSVNKAEAFSDYYKNLK